RLEGLRERVVAGQDLVLAPAGIGPVFLCQVGTRHLERRPLVLGAIDLPRIGQLPRKRLSYTRELGAVERQLAGDLGYCGMRVDKPAVAEPRGTQYCAVVIGGEPDRWVRLLDRPARHCDIGQLADVVLEADLVLGPQTFDDFEALLEPAHPLPAGHAKGIELDIA